MTADPQPADAADSGIAVTGRQDCGPAGPVPSAAIELADLRENLRRQLWSLVVDEQLPLPSANGLLIRLGEPPLQRQWTVDVSIPVRCDVLAGSAREATDAAEAMIANALEQAGPLPIDVLWEARSSTEPVRGDLDRDNP